jgi:hypothetical protein
MPTLACGHSAAEETRWICRHLLENKGADYRRRFTGKGRAFDLICGECSRNLDCVEENLRTVCSDCWRGVEEEGTWEGIVGQPEVLERESGLSFSDERIALAEPFQERILDIQPIPSCDQNLWIVVTETGQLCRLDLDRRSVLPLCHLSEAPLNLSEQVSLHVSDSGRTAAVVNTKGRSGVVVDLDAGQVTMSLDRSEYHNAHCTFPVAFCEVEGRSLLIHATAWNRLDISDPLTGELLTVRTPAPYRRGESRPEHYLNYFHCGLTVSPDQGYVADNGWVWHPDGLVTVWSVRRWLRENVWESEDGGSRKSLCWRAYFWDGPLCWVGARCLAVWGYGNDDEWLIPAVRLFDVSTGQEDRWFPGPKGTLVFDEFLFSSDGEEGTSVWDVDTGERLLRAESFCPLRYHRGAKCILSVRPDGLFQVSRLRGRTVDPNWLTWNGGTVVRLAQAIADKCAFDGLPALADALEEAGCQEAAILAHCRQPGPHGERCWLIDLILDRE